jgi:pimeloyl-ACP methyl ester carboxylesterase
VRETVAGRTFDTSELELPDGRTLAWSEFGAPDGDPVLYFHGATTCRYEGLGAAPFAAALGLRVIAPDRPGAGRSSPNPVHGQRSWANDVERLADRLGIERFAVAGTSAGGWHAVGVAGFLADRVRSCAAINTAGDRHHPAWAGVGLKPRMLLRLLMLPGFARRIAFEPARRAPERAMAKRPKVDQADIAQHRDWLVPAFREGLRQGTAAPEQDAALIYDRVWAMPIDAVPGGVHVFQGREDMLIGFVREAARRAPSVRLTEIEGGHLGGWTDQVWRAIAADARAD